MYGILFDGAQRLFDGNHGLIYPDFIGKDAGERIIADAKYKPWNNISGKDYLQILAYMFRFDEKRGYYLYPEATHQADVSLRLNRGMTYEDNVSPRNDVLVIKCGLQIPDGAKDYADCVLLPASARSKKAQWEVPRKANGWAYGFGQANVWYASEEDSRLQEYLTRLEKQIDEYNGENWIDKYAG